MCLLERKIQISKIVSKFAFAFCKLHSNLRLLAMVEGLKEKWQELAELVESLKKCESDQKRIEQLDQHPRVRHFVESANGLNPSLSHLSREGELIVKSLIAIGQDDHVLCSSSECPEFSKKLEALIDELSPVETFYKEMGGIVGYHWMMFTLLSQKLMGTYLTLL